MLSEPKPLGTIVMPLGWRGGWRKVRITGGPFDGRPDGEDAFNVAVRAERVQAGDADVHLPIRDFSIPNSDADVAVALIQTMRAALQDKEVYVGCMGGYGRTGLFLALLAKTAGIEDPVEWVRDNYNGRAVETERQYDYIDDFDVSGVRRAVFGYAWGVTLCRISGLPYPK
ncbi:hypothetical protein [Hyphomicrobium sp. ghe19]|uniref:protein-tyrosine phosphatase family protein n=1 Tax=Hyphomicrobium sp. ghe19 TaxID=2682968 RepID=UPI001366ACCE|nr:hypothetical protein HYPP_02519 [Hyphomicrobium sp. ghe19]